MRTSDLFDVCEGFGFGSHSIDSRVFRFLGHAGVKRNVGKFEICVLSKFQPCAPLGGRKNDEKSKRKILIFVVKFDSIDSIIFQRYT